MTVTSSSTSLRNALATVLEDEFDGSGIDDDVPAITVIADKLDESVGWDGQFRVALYPDSEVPYPRDSQVWRPTVILQFFGPWDKEIDPQQTVDPTPVETWAERFKRACQGAAPHTTQTWFFEIVRVVYSDDPTGNKTRFEAEIAGWTQNPSLVETTG